MIHRELRDSIAIVRMEHGKVNAIDAELFNALAVEFENLASAPVTAVILTGTGKAFSAGVDLFRVLNEGAPYIDRFLPAFSSHLEQLYLFPKPVIAAVNGHAIAGGCVLTCACDYRIMAQGPGTIGAPELLVGVPFPPLALEIVRSAVAPQHAQEIVYTGRVYSPDDALHRGIIDEVVSPEALMDRALQMAASLGAIPSKSFRIAKQYLRDGSLARAKKSNLDEEVLQTWKDPEIHTIIREYLARTIGKR